MKCLVTGGAGFIGSNIVDNLIEKNHKVIIIDNLTTGTKENINEKAVFYEMDIRDKKVEDVFKKEKPEIVFHTAAQIDVRKSVEDPIWDSEINISGSLNILENCKKYNVKKFIFSSTGGAIYGDTENIPTTEKEEAKPISPYGICKLSVEKYLHYYGKIFGLDYVSLRYSNVYGPRQNSKGEAGVVAIFIDKILNNEQPLINGDGKQTRDYVFVKDVVNANMLAFEKNITGIYNIGTANETTVNEIFRLINKNLGNKAEKKHAPAKKGEQQRSCLDYGKAEKALGWKPEYNIEKGIKETVDWFKNKDKN
ncbi:SDR family oxidoreductase [Candidatus Woesearchaeota archaeon]|nr:SDR family oxidoreductase [Candidatus Woesearchaeota archaeon]